MGVGFPRGKKGNRVNTNSARLALANNSDDPYRSYFCILHIPLRELFLRVVQQPHETTGVETKNRIYKPPRQPNGIFSDSKNVCCAFELFCKDIPTPPGALAPQLLKRNDLSIDSIFCRCMDVDSEPEIEEAKDVDTRESRPPAILLQRGLLSQKSAGAR